MRFIKWMLPIVSATVTTLLIFALLIFKYRINEQYKKEKYLQEQIDAEKSAIHLLEAELSHLSRPERIRDLYIKYGKLGPIPKEKISLQNIGK